MEQVKVFYVCNSPARLETEINKWLSEMGDHLEITGRLQAASGRIDHHVTVTIFYKKIPNPY